MLAPQILISCGDLIICSQNSNYTIYNIRKSTITENVNDNYVFQYPIRQVFETTNPQNYDPGLIFILIDGSTIFYSYFDKKYVPVSLIVPNKSIVLNNFTTIIIEENNLYSVSSNGNQKNLLAEDIPDDSFFICSNSKRGLLISSSKPLALIVSSKKVQNIPHGFASSMISATFFDSDSIAFATNDKKVHLYNKNNEIITIEMKDNIIKMNVADLNSFERSLICLTEEKSIVLVHFKSKTVSPLSLTFPNDSVRANKKSKEKQKESQNSNFILDFCVIHNPFDRVVLLPEVGKIQYASFEDSNQMDSAVKSIIEAYDSRIITGLSCLSNMRRRLALRNQLAMNEKPQLPVMVPLFGSLEAPSNNDDSASTNTEDQVSNNLQFWLENVNGTNFEIHCNSEVPLIFDVIICSQKVTFCYAYEIEMINENSYKIKCSFNIESMFGYDSFAIFVKLDDSNAQNEFKKSKCIFIGFIDFPLIELSQNKSIDRISADYYISFPLLIPFSQKTEQESSQTLSSSSLERSLNQADISYEAADKGIVLHITADSINNFQQKVFLVQSSLPESSTIQKRENMLKQACLAKELSKCIEKFLQSMIMESELSIDKQRLVIFKTEIDDLLSSFLW